ncbi:MAG: DUF937 domain-containing protein [Firmicutes bacterium]|nr:DUF937 domain-containing protein [Bacillota bacterium]
MNLMNMLTSALTSGAALKALSAKTGLSEKQLKMIIAIAVPLLLKKMTSNASNQSGATSLLGALTQHQSKKGIPEQLESADAEDGSKIVGHILGDERENLVNEVAAQAGADPKDVNIVLGNISPTVMNGLSAATESASAQQSSGVNLSDGFDLSDVMGLLGGAASQGSSQAGLGQEAPASGVGSLLGSLFGGAPASAGSASSGAASGGLGSLFGSLLGASAPEEDHSVNGTQLIQSLLSMMK